MLSGFLRSWTMEWAKLPDDREAFGLHQFARWSWLNSRRRRLICCSRLNDRAGERSMSASISSARDEINLAFLLPPIAMAERGAGLDDGHFAENFPGAELGKDSPGVAAPPSGNFHQPFLDKINAVAGRAFAENLRAGGEGRSCVMRRKPAIPRAIKIAEQGDGLQVRP